MTTKTTAVLAFQDPSKTRPEILREFSELISSGAHHRLRGWHHRAAVDLIARGIIQDDGTIAAHPAFPQTTIAA